MRFNPPPNWPRAVVVLLVVLVVGYGVTVLVSADIWNKDEPIASTRATFVMQPLTGESVTPEDLTTAREVLANRTTRLGGQHVSVSGDANTATVSATDVTEDQLRGIAEVGRLHMRPVMHVIPSHADSSAVSDEHPTAAQIRDEKALRQSTNQQIQLLALQFQSTRCGKHDPLADNDDPTLPLITCSQDGTQVYLLDASILNADAIESASAGWNQQFGQDLVTLQFNDAATKAWASFTRDNIGSQVAFVVDTAVLSAPTIREQISGGHAQITGFTAASARSLAAVVAEKPLPVALTVQSVRTVTLNPSFWTVPRIAVVAGGVVVLMVVVVGLVLLGRTRRVGH